MTQDCKLGQEAAGFTPRILDIEARRSSGEYGSRRCSIQRPDLGFMAVINIPSIGSSVPRSGDMTFESRIQKSLVLPSHTGSC